ncbi:GNAT family N-acetyltransferase [Diplocloster agilis]|uniref:GNAT family N-acetyltransferase n=1 Tax=Diplocloster agilis TaxID=2850323 RepID=A0A949K5P5_9FIRM|nr:MULTISPECIES: GNAT family N-acetyltransferase [Lachnospiraceae]MBU9739690.1 GNAT family N-acetyltransferase [Diplocloster agilis]MCU6736991.1 GNAT family N-acetyltransferase [Suonthocola fibrivorans]SCJ95024.1 Predicted acetyltransferase [uncultured Clostridium sp.]
MLKKCGSEDKGILTGYLSKEKEYNTFLLADVNAYGFDADCQDVWMDWEEGRCTGVFLRFYTNLLVYTQEKELNAASLDFILKNHEILVIMGKSSLFAPLETKLEKEYRCCQKQLYRLESRELLKPHCPEVTQAGVADVDEVFAFLGSIKEISGLYTSKEMIRDRIANQDGIHLMIRKDGRMISHGNSTTGSEHTIMIGGVATEPAYRRQGYASCVVSALCEYILNQGKTPCLFTGEGADALFAGLGFEKLGGWTTLERI